MVHRPELQIVSIETWELAQRVAEKRRVNMPGTGAWTKHPFSGLLQCSNCGGPMYGQGYVDKRVKNPQYRSQYRCSNRTRFREKACPRGQSVNERIVATALLPFVADIIEQKLGLESVLEGAVNRYGKTGPEEGIEAEVKAEIVRTTNAKQRVVKAIAGGIVTDEEASTQLAELRRKSERLQRELVKLKRKDEIRADFLTAIESLRSQDIEATLWALLEKRRKVLGRIMRLLFKPSSIVIRCEGNTRARRGYLESYEFTDEFLTLIENSTGVRDRRFTVPSSRHL
jgi:hypothetical protein